MTDKYETVTYGTAMQYFEEGWYTLALLEEIVAAMKLRNEQLRESLTETHTGT